MEKDAEKDVVADRFCLNHYLAEDGLSLDEHNEFSANFVSFSVPIYGENLHQKIYNIIFEWFGEMKPNFQGDAQARQLVTIDSKSLDAVPKLIEVILK